MAAPGWAGLSPREQVSAELHRIRAEVTGVSGSVVATSDGFPLAHDAPALEPTEIAALVATTRALASRITHATATGQFKEVVTRGSDGYLAVYAAGPHAIVSVIGTADLNVGMLHVRARDMIERIASISAEFTGAAAPADAATTGRATREQEPGQPLPVRRPGRLPVRRPH